MSLDVHVEPETVWLSLDQMAALFDRDKSLISRHLRNVFVSRELARKSVVAENATTATDGEIYQVEYFNLDAIISVGHRVNSKRGTQFRIWATNVLREHIIKGYTHNDRRLAELKQTVRLIAEVAEHHDLTSDEARAVLRVVSDYSQALELLDDYDHQRVGIPELPEREVSEVTLPEVESIVEKLRGAITDTALFGRRKDCGLAGALGAVMQTFDGVDVYPSLEEKAANLLYLLVKNHPFVDGNKRIAASVFCGSWKRTTLSTVPMARSKSPIMRLWR